MEESDLEKSRRQKKIEKLILTEEEVNLHGRLEDDDDDISVVASALARSTTIKVLYLGSNAIGAAEVKLIADALLSNTDSKLQELYLDENDIGDDGVQHLADVLRHSKCQLQTLDLGYNDIGPDGAKYLANCVSF